MAGLTQEQLAEQTAARAVHRGTRGCCPPRAGGETSRRCPGDAIRRAIGDQPGEAQTANNLADAYLRQQRFAEALDLLQRTLDLQRQLGHEYGEAIALNNLGEAYLNLGRPDDAGHLSEAQESWRRAISLFEAVGDRAKADIVRSDLATLDLPEA